MVSRMTPICDQRDHHWFGLSCGQSKLHSVCSHFERTLLLWKINKDGPTLHSLLVKQPLDQVVHVLHVAVTIFQIRMHSGHIGDIILAPGCLLVTNAFRPMVL